VSPAEIKKALSEIITEIQTNSGLECPLLEGSVVPANDIPHFDSKVWLVATTMLASKIGIEIPHDENIFVGKETNEQLNLDEICELVSKIVKVSKSKDVAA
jgi:hypothetical protein